jgi:hypothetical protein
LTITACALNRLFRRRINSAAILLPSFSHSHALDDRVGWFALDCQGGTQRTVPLLRALVVWQHLTFHALDGRKRGPPRNFSALNGHVSPAQEARHSTISDLALQEPDSFRGQSVGTEVAPLDKWDLAALWAFTTLRGSLFRFRDTLA